MTFTDYVTDIGAQYTMGWSLVVTVALYMLFNLGYVLIAGGRVITLVLIKYATILWMKLKKIMKHRFSRQRIGEVDEDFHDLVRQISQQPVKFSATKIMSSLRRRRSRLFSGEEAEVIGLHRDANLISLDDINDTS
mmetsp:Transcript_6152/g.9893  ORF Transcript_6152/g.9893 Transcript_6152/m.9893 type:complete len:136 (+) Transcript_6152:4727-5134(+)